jgi:ABC-type transport system involved in cytochrome c biogenesis permease subunit
MIMLIFLNFNFMYLFLHWFFFLFEEKNNGTKAYSFFFFFVDLAIVSSIEHLGTCICQIIMEQTSKLALSWPILLQFNKLRILGGITTVLFWNC